MAATGINITSTALGLLGWTLKRTDGHLQLGARKQQGNGSEPYTSTNYNGIGTFAQQSPDVDIDLFGQFASIEIFEDALYSLYALFVVPGERTIVHTDGTSSITFKGILNKGAKVKVVGKAPKIVATVKLSILKTND